MTKVGKNSVYLDTYFEAVESVLAAVRSTQRDAIIQAADAVANSLANGGAWLVMDTGHMLRHEAFMRAGGMVALTPFSWTLTVESPLEHRTASATSEEMADIEKRTVALALDSSKLKPGDVMVINSNSGRTSNVIELALQCAARGIVTIALCSAEQLERCEPAHPSGKKLFDVCPIQIDNCSPYGDAAVEVRDNEKMCPMSGLAGTYILWAIHAEVVERLQSQNLNPTIFRSVHVGSLAFVEEQKKQFLKKGL